MKRSLTLIALMALIAGPAMSQRTPGSDLARLQAEYQDEAVRARRLRADAADATAELGRLNRQLDALKNDQSDDDTQIAAQRARLRELSAREAQMVGALSKERGRQGRLLSALQMMSRRPPPPLLIPAEEAIDTVRASILMRAMAPELQARAKVLTDQQSEIVRVRRRAALSSERLFTSESAQGDRRGEIEALSARQSALRAVLKADAERAERAAATLEARIRALGAVPASPTEGDVETASTTRLPGGRSRLSPPVSGSPEVRFGDGSSGWRWRAAETEVTAPAAAEVDYAGPLSGWGQVVILKLGPGWRAVVAGLSELSVEPGARVEDGQVLGRSGPDADVYFELRRDDRPIDPGPWLR